MDPQIWGLKLDPEIGPRIWALKLGPKIGPKKFTSKIMRNPDVCP